MKRHLKPAAVLAGLLAVCSASLSAQCCGEPNYYGNGSGNPNTNWKNYNYYSAPCEPCHSPVEYCGPCDNWVIECDDECGLFFGAEGLWWTVCQDNLDYAVEFDNSEGAEVLLGPGDTEFLDYDWCGGARGHIGFRSCGWDYIASYTWYRNDSDTHTNTEDSDTDLKASLLHPATVEENAEIATIDSEITYQAVDFMVGRDITLCGNSILLHPNFGFKGIKLKQDLKAVYEGEDFATPTRVRWDSDLYAGGLAAGMDMGFEWGCGFGMYGSFEGSVLASRTDIHHRQETLVDGSVDSTAINLKNKEWVCVPGYQLAAGLSWEASCGDCFAVMLKLGYEFNQWFNTPQLRRYHSGNEGVSSDAYGNLALHGASFSANFYF